MVITRIKSYFMTISAAFSLHAFAQWECIETLTDLRTLPMAPVDVSTLILGFSFPIQLIRPSNQLWAWLQISTYGTLPIVLCRINHYSIPLLARPPIRALEPVPTRNRHPLIQKNSSTTTNLESLRP